MEINHEIIKDAICLADPTVNRKNIVFENVLVRGDVIIAPYRELVWSNRFSIWSNRFSISIEEHDRRLKQKQRESNLNQIGI